MTSAELPAVIRSASFSAVRHEGLDPVEASWRDFEARGAATAFQRLDWVRAIERHLVTPARGRLFVIEVRDDGRTRMLLPFVRLSKPGFRVIEFLGLGVCDYSAPVLAPGTAEIDASEGPALWRAIRAALPPADLLRIGQICRRVGGRANPLAVLPGVETSPIRSFDVAISGNGADVVARIANGQTRRILKTAARRIKERGDARFVQAETAGEIDRLVSEMIAQRRRRFGELGRFDLLADPAVQSFYRDVARLGTAGPVRLFGLSVGDTCIATALCLRHAESLILTIPTMAGDEWKACSPGMTLMARFLEWARADGSTVMDFSVGEMAYKTGFGGSAHDLLELTVSLTVRGRVLAGSQRVVSKAKAEVRRNQALFRWLRGGMQFYRRLLRGRMVSGRHKGGTSKDRDEVP